jgi:hypothetical protein
VHISGGGGGAAADFDVAAEEERGVSSEWDGVTEDFGIWFFLYEWVWVRDREQQH